MRPPFTFEADAALAARIRQAHPIKSGRTFGTHPLIDVLAHAQETGEIIDLPVPAAKPAPTFPPDPDAVVTDRYARTVYRGVNVTVWASDGKIIAGFTKGHRAERIVLDHNSLHTVGAVDFAAYLDQAKGELQ